MIPLNQKVSILLSDLGNDAWGIPVKSPNFKTYKVRLDFNSNARIIQTEDGKDYIFSATIYFKGAVPLTYNDFVKYDSGLNGIISVNPKAIFPITDLSGKVTYTKVTV